MHLCDRNCASANMHVNAITAVYIEMDFLIEEALLAI